MILPYYGEFNEEIVNRFDNYVKELNLKCHIDSVYDMKDFYEAHTHLECHYIGKLAIASDMTASVALSSVKRLQEGEIHLSQPLFQ